LGYWAVGDFFPSDPFDVASSPNYCVALRFDSFEQRFHLAASQLNAYVERVSNPKVKVELSAPMWIHNL